MMRLAHERKSIRVVVRVSHGNNGCTTPVSTYSFNTALLHPLGSVLPLAPCQSHLPPSAQASLPEAIVSRYQRTIALRSWGGKRIVFDRDMAHQTLQQLAAATPTTTEHAQMETSNQNVQTPADLQQNVTPLEKLRITHDRHLREQSVPDHLDLGCHHENRVPISRQAWVDNGNLTPTAGHNWWGCGASSSWHCAKSTHRSNQKMSKKISSEKRLENRLCGMQRRPTGAGKWPRHKPSLALSLSPNRAEQQIFRLNLPSKNLSKANPGSETSSTPPQPHQNSTRVSQHWRPLARCWNRFTWPRVACETAGATGPKLEQIHVATGRM